MFLMWIIVLLLIGPAVYAVAGNNLANALKPVASRTCPIAGGRRSAIAKLPAARTDIMKEKQNEKD